VDAVTVCQRIVLSEPWNQFMLIAYRADSSEDINVSNVSLYVLCVFPTYYYSGSPACKSLRWIVLTRYPATY